ncbi:hypothetical protein LLG46_12570 [bacterium]|nr:hypothetical protein [bacterium]
MGIGLNIKHVVSTPVKLLLIAITILLVGCSSGTPHVPFTGLREKSVLYDGWTECPNGDGSYMRAYQLYPFAVKRWVERCNKLGEKWICGPIYGPTYIKAFCWSKTYKFDHGGPVPQWPYKQWLKSDQYYFYLEYYKEFSYGGLGRNVHYSSIWVLDSKSYRLYHVAGSM